MQDTSTSKMMWRQALSGGLILGIALFLWDYIGYLADLPSFVTTPVQLLILAAGIVWFGGKLRAWRGAELGFSYGACFGFVLALMLCAGVVYGVGAFFLQTVIAPDHFAELQEIALLESGLDENVIEQALAMRNSALFKNPLTFMFSGVFSLVFMGGLLGLILSAFLQRKPDPFAGRHENYNPEA